MAVTAKPLKSSNRPLAAEADRLTEAIELLFFAYRDFISDPDELLAEYDFGRAHHRVVHFVGRNPGITVAELLNILRITKQSLARVLKQLIERGFIEQETGKQDRRQRLLFLTPKGSELAERLAIPQRNRVAQALEKAGPGSDEAWRKVLLALVNDEDRPEVEHRIAKAPARG
ncbi:transcriptional regulator, MarR family [Parvibaculum lavamentivorans DS-1]|uniref:Transcriptional regulator, MarR family n=1 Tax=Parvibaculum lavamentivorans (strain DS-1 / DSM 13023 / NCIMB 13966) TaxID=402881 RepID=A7HVF1_PARL1|nr:transcriptional regulator, MarR family [Parvibaculum lavamentivorans DS-1]